MFIDVGVFVVEKGQIMPVMKFFEVRKKAEPRVCDAIEGILERMLVLLRNEFVK